MQTRVLIKSTPYLLVTLTNPPCRFPPQLQVIFFSLKPTESFLCCLSVHGCLTICWTQAAFLNKTNFPSPAAKSSSDRGGTSWVPPLSTLGF